MLILFFGVVARMCAYKPHILEDDYISVLQNYVDTPYAWGGESHIGIDCSGLIRVAMIESTEMAAKTYLRPDIYWQRYILLKNDFRARDIMTDFQKFAFVKRIENLNQTNIDDLKPGDLAVLETGTHVMAYLGQGEWIEANGSRKKVIRVRLPATNDLLHYTKPVLIYRWRILSHQGLILRSFLGENAEVIHTHV